MTEIRDQTLMGSVPLDGNHFVNVTFEGTEMLYDGGIPPTFNNCRFENATFNFRGAAGQTVEFLRAMAPANTNMRQVVHGLIPELAD